jgi:hypothetical protein
VALNGFLQILFVKLISICYMPHSQINMIRLSWKWYKSKVTNNGKKNLTKLSYNFAPLLQHKNVGWCAWVFNQTIGGCRIYDHLFKCDQIGSATIKHASEDWQPRNVLDCVLIYCQLSFSNHIYLLVPTSDMEFFTLFQWAKIGNLLASAKILWFPPLFSIIFYVIKCKMLDRHNIFLWKPF